MNEQKIKNLLGLAQRAGKLISGDFAVEKAVKRGGAPLVLLAMDCAANNTKKYTQMETHGVPLRTLLTKEELGQAIGKELRAVVLVNDSGFAKALLAEIDQ
ncbi:ribosomal L7Ae/L30e/S12e/Gadd45 family protein [uncultured Veillonella sp.]|uniref:L7Ae/L30e/S12e/Gadd45 family ribosomal protein n=1 Tax=uncultured Veillonella sp. TaxID=159268 RepID=UPI00258514D3|nr:ribosomal L7Ae/L30e/S12e/Gadd45 family protein [uncultured Veillonella sp.]